MKLEVGKRYVTRNGRVTLDMVRCLSTRYPFAAGLVDYSSQLQWTPDGRFNPAEPEHPYDLITEYHEPEPPAEPAGQPGIDPKGSEGSEGAKKAPLHFLPSVALHETSWVLAGGAVKYGPWNWRENKVCMSTYRSAIGRHLDAWYDDREDADPESKRSHLAHVIASASILLDAMAHGTLVDDRPPKP